MKITKKDDKPFLSEDNENKIHKICLDGQNATKTVYLSHHNS